MPTEVAKTPVPESITTPSKVEAGWFTILRLCAPGQDHAGLGSTAGPRIRRDPDPRRVHLGRPA